MYFLFVLYMKKIAKHIHRLLIKLKESCIIHPVIVCFYLKDNSSNELPPIASFSENDLPLRKLVFNTKARLPDDVGVIQKA